VQQRQPAAGIEEERIAGVVDQRREAVFAENPGKGEFVDAKAASAVVAEYPEAAAYLQQLCFGSLGTPSLSRMVIIGHQLVKPDWNRLRPTKAVNQSQRGSW